MTRTRWPTKLEVAIIRPDAEKVANSYCMSISGINLCPVRRDFILVFLDEETEAECGCMSC